MQNLKMLSRQELQQFNRVKNSQYGLQENTLELCIKYYLEYRNNINTPISSDKIAVALRSALFMAEKSTHIVNLQGQKISAPSLTLGGLLKSHPLDQVMITLKDLTKNVTINDKQASTQLNNLIKDISFLITYHKKFEKSIEKLQLKERNPQSAEYIKYWTFMTWLFYIEVRSKLLKKSLDVIQNTCLLAHTLAFMLSFGWQHIIPMGILKIQKKINENSSMKQVFGPFRQIIVYQMFSIKTDTIYTHLASKFQDYFQKELIGKKIIKTNQNYDFLSPDLLLANYRRLDKHYERQINGMNLDQRIFLKERTANLTPSKFTPFSRQGYANKGKKIGGNKDVTMKQNYGSHRILNYQNIDKQQNPIKPSNQGFTLGRLPKAVLVSPSMMKVPLICATPVSGGMEMMNYVNQKAKKFQDTFNQGLITRRPKQSSVIKHIELIFDKSKKDMDKKTKQIKQQIVYSFFKLALQDYLCQNPSQIDNQTCYKAFMGLSIELFLFANNSSVTFEDVERDLKIQPFELWKACDFFLKFDKSMPVSLKLHLLDIQVGIISYKLWKSFDFIEQINDFANNSIHQGHQFIQKLFKRLLHQIGFQIHQLGQNLKLQERNLQHIYYIMKQIICESTDMLFMKHIDQLIICAVFAINKKEKLQIKFNEVINSYRQINYHNSDLHDMIIHNIHIKQKEKPVNVIVYYNDYFIKRIRQYIINLPQELQLENKKNYSNNPILASPLKDILPRDVNKKNIKNIKHDQCHKDLLISYNDSPLLKHQPLAFKGKQLKATGVINYDEESQNIKHNIQSQKHSPRNIVNNHHVQITKKFSGQNINVPWMKPQLPTNPMNNPSITPPRSKNMLHQQLGAQLSQFSSNPTPNNSQQNRIITKTVISQYGANGMSKPIRSKYP